MSEPLPTVRTPDALARTVSAWRESGLRVGFAPTMGALHAGHLSLLDIAREHADRVVASVFVNPTQFAPGEDFEAYPRDEAGDAGLLSGAGCDLLYAPERAAIYPPGFATSVRVEGVAEGLETAHRPHFFEGVATVVTKLLNQVRPDVAVFGEKDYQQLLVVKRLSKDLDLGVEIIGAPTLREADGLAMSSRNAYLKPEARRIAAALNRVLADVGRALADGGDASQAERDGEAALLKAGFDAVYYVAVRDPETLTAYDPARGRSARILGAARVGGVRLIDNLAAPE